MKQLKTLMGKFNVKWLAPLGMLCAFLALWSFMFYPMLNATPEHVPFAIVSLDEGAGNAGVEVNAGRQIVDRLTGSDASGEDGESPIDWIVFETKAELDKALEGNDYYGAIVIPKDFTAKQLAAKQAESRAALQQAQAQQALQQKLAQAKAQGMSDEQITQMQQEAMAQAQQAQSGSSADKPTVELITNSAKNASVTQQLASSMSAKLAESGVKVETSSVHDYDLGKSTGASMLGQLSVAPIVAMSASCTMIMFMMTRVGSGASRRERARRLGIQIGYAAILSLCVGGLACFLMGVIGGMTLPWGTLLPFLWLCSFCIMCMLIGAMTLLFPLGTVAMFVLMGTMSAAYIAPEMMPALWHDWVLPWSPAHFVVDGVRSIVFLGDGVLNANSGAMMTCILIGAVLAAVGLALPSQKPVADEPAAETVGAATAATAVA